VLVRQQSITVRRFIDIFPGLYYIRAISHEWNPKDISDHICRQTKHDRVRPSPPSIDKYLHIPIHPNDPNESDS